MVVSPAGFEPTAPGLGILCSILLSYGDAGRSIASGNGTLFLSLLSAYSMDGDFALLPEIVTMVEELVPAGAFHIVVDEEHTTGLYGAQGKGFVSLLGLETRIHTVLHTFGKACGFNGGTSLYMVA